MADSGDTAGAAVARAEASESDGERAEAQEKLENASESGNVSGSDRREQEGEAAASQEITQTATDESPSSSAVALELTAVDIDRGAVEGQAVEPVTVTCSSATTVQVGEVDRAGGNDVDEQGNGHDNDDNDDDDDGEDIAPSPPHKTEELFAEDVGSASAGSVSQSRATTSPTPTTTTTSSSSSSSSSLSSEAAAAPPSSSSSSSSSSSQPSKADREALDEFSDLALMQAKTLAPGKIVLHSAAKEIADRHRDIAHRCTQDADRKTIVAHLQAFLMNDRVLKALKEKRAPKEPSKPAVLERSACDIHVTWSPHLDDRKMDPLHYEICWGFRFTGAWSKCMCTAPRHLITGLKPGTNYQVKVRSYNARGFGPYSDLATISTGKADSSGGGKGSLRAVAQAASKSKPSIFSIFKAIPAGYEELVNSIIRPPRGSYDLEELGAPKFRIRRNIFHRSDFVVHNFRGLRLQCSHWEPIAKQRKTEKMPCLIYLHGNCGCRADAVECLEQALTHGFTLLSCDLSGSGKSEGEYISLGYHERDDVAALIRHAQEQRHASDIYLWGRSMGAVTSLLVAAQGGPDLIKGMVLDSPFEDLWTLAQELVANTEIKIPSFAIGMVRVMMRNSVQKRADFNIDALSPIKMMPECTVPALFAGGIDDAFVGSHHAENLFNAHAGIGHKQFVRFPGDHNSIREDWFLDRAMVFLETGCPVHDMPYNVPSTEQAATQRQIQKSQAAQVNDRDASDDANPNDILNVAAVLNKMQNANEREYVAAVPGAAADNTAE